MHAMRLRAVPGTEAGRRMLRYRRGSRVVDPPRNRARARQVDVPGGYVDFGENAADAALRETREEVGMRVTQGPLLGVFNDSAITVVVYLATPGKEPPSLSVEATEVRYFAPDDVPWIDLAFPTTTDALTAWIALTRGSNALH